MFTTYAIPEKLDREINELEQLIKKYNNKEIDAVTLKAHRVPFGIYEQRDEQTFMVRVRCAAGIITPKQFYKVAEVAKKYTNGRIHVTTRQELQIHNADLDDVPAILRELRAANLSTRGGGGNTLRNIIVSINSGIDDELFDVTPYAVALTSKLISEDDSWNLPRKYKIAFSNSSNDTANATVQDLGFFPQLIDGKKGFKVYGAGGMGAKPEIGKLLINFIPEENVYAVAKAMKNLFYKYGNRKNRYAARIRFLWNKLGEKEFKKLLFEEYESVLSGGNYKLEITPIENRGEDRTKPADVDNSKEFIVWKKRFTSAQKQESLYSILFPLKLGDIESEKALALAVFLESFGDNSIRFSLDQNIYFRNIKEIYLPNIFHFIKENFPENESHLLKNLLSCAGADTCKLGFCLSTGVSRAIINLLKKSENLDDKIDNVKINISGCPNSCGQHWIGDLGFFGYVARKGTHIYPAYNVLTGSVLVEGKSKYAQKRGEISARDLPDFIRDILTAYSKSDNDDFTNYLVEQGDQMILTKLKKYSEVPTFEDDKNYYFDWGSEEIFSLAKRGAGECSAGVFDFIERDLKNVKTVKERLNKLPESDETKQGLLEDLLFFSARMLLVTKGAETADRKSAFDSFVEYFIDTDLIDKNYKQLFASSKLKVKEVVQFSDDILKLYDSMDDSLNFLDVKKSSKLAKALSFKDLRGVACPMNFVKAKVEMAKITSGDIIEILLDDGAPIQNVPGSLKSEGHEILKQGKVENHWSITVKKS